jgi:Alpha/beta hydrolase family
MPVQSNYTFVLVHGAWHGGWCWRRAAALLRSAGHLVFTPTFTGFGERVHLIRTGLTIEDFRYRYRECDCG